MSLATRCPACGTVFRVVQDQLRVSDGWVRCGRCTEVFNAVEHMVDATTAGLGTPPQGAALREAGGVGGRAGAGAGSGSSSAVQPWPGAPQGTSGDDRSRGASDAQQPAHDAALPRQPWDGDETGTDGTEALEIWAEDDDATSPRPEREGEGVGEGDPTVHAEETMAADVVSLPDAEDSLAADPTDRLGPTAGLTAAARAAHPQAATAVQSAPSGAGKGTASVAPGAMTGLPMPSFLRQAERAERWRQPRVRAALAGACVLAALLLIGQAAHTWRDLLAARQPGLQPLLAQSCAVLGCSLQPPRLIDALVVDSSALVRLERSSLYRLQVTLRNRQTLAVAMPALDLSLTDSQGRLIARRVLLPKDLGAGPDSLPDSLPAGAEQVLQATLQTEHATVAGYTIELFYP